MQPKNQSNYADSVRAWASGYEDSVAVDYDMSQMRTIYVHKDNAESWRGQQENDNSTASANWQYWMVPTFFAVMFALIIFAFVLYRDNDRALRQKRTDKIMSFIKNK
jgi:hypothetical protein